MSIIFGVPESIINQIKFVRNDIVHPKKSKYSGFNDYDKINSSLINRIATLAMLLKSMPKLGGVMININNLKYLYNVKVLCFNYAVIDSMLEEKGRNLYNQMINMMECNKKEIDKIDNPELKSITIKTFNMYLDLITKSANIEANIELDW